MSRDGLKISRLFGKSLPTFSTEAEAERRLKAVRDRRLRKFETLAESSETFAADYTPASLKSMEKWYFNLYESSAFVKIATTREEFEECMAVYLGEVFVRNTRDATWVVEKFVFEPGKYEIGVQRGLLTIMLRRRTDHFQTRDNKRKQSIWREYNRYAS